MVKSITINFARVVYRGTSIGRDIQIDIKILGRAFKIIKRINVGETKEINQYLDTFETKGDVFDPKVIITVTEKDLLFSESNTIEEPIHVTTTSDKSQFFTFTIKVGERRSWWKRIFWGNHEAVFEVQLEAKVQSKTSFIQKYSYAGITGNENYNRFDDLIVEMVDYWNGEFAKDTDPPLELLDPSLVKAMMYQESRIGYFEGSGVNVMQVGNHDDPSIKTLRGELKEYWIHDGEQILLQYDARVESVRDSIRWGVRWLYHKAQGIQHDGHRYWNTWKEAVSGYGPGKKEYGESVWSIYNNGVKKEKDATLRLWTIAFLLPFVAFSLISTAKNNDITSVILSTLDSREKLEVDNLEIKRSEVNSSLLAAVIESEKDWWEKLKIGTQQDNQINWLKVNPPPTEQSILSFRFVKLKGFELPLLEVYGQTHAGHGNLYLYEVNNQEARRIFETEAVDTNPDFRWSKENMAKYGYSTCGETYEGGALKTEYGDTNGDGVADLILKGQRNIYCENILGTEDGYIQSEDVKVDEVPVRREYVIR